MSAVDLAEVDRRQYRRLLTLARQRPEEPRSLAARDLAFVLHDVLADAFRRDREVGKRHGAWWERVETAVVGALTREQLDQQLFLVGAYGTVAGVELALEGSEQSLVVEHFRSAAGGVLRLRRSQPGRWHIDRAVARFRAASPEPPVGSFLHVAAVFTASCALRSPRPDTVEAAADVLGEIGLEAFYDAASGTVNAIAECDVVP